MASLLAFIKLLVILVLPYSFTHAQLFITTLPELLLKAPNSTKLIEGSVIMLYCEVNSSSSSALSVSWNKDGGRLVQDVPHIILRTSTTSSSTTLLLVLDNIVSSDAGLYQCTAQDGTIKATGDTLNITVISSTMPGALQRIADVRPANNRTIIVNGSVMLSFAVERVGNDSNAYSTPSVALLKDGTPTNITPINTENSYGRLNSSLSFVFHASDAGVYHCLFVDNDSGIYGTFPLRLDTGAFTTPERISPPLVFLTPPEKLVLEIATYGAYGSIIWQKDGVALGTMKAQASITEFTYYNEIFFREPTTASDYGLYEAYYSGQSGITGATINVSSRVKPNTAIGVGLSEFISVGEGESINISCTSAGVPVPSITWTFNGQLTNFSQTDTIIENQGYVVSTLHIVHARYELHDGVYQCAGSNYGGDPTKSAANITVQVLVVPIVQITADNTIIPAGDDIRLTCSVLRGNPPQYNYTWSFIGNTNSITSLESTPMIYLSSVQPDNSGIYHCSVVNCVGRGVANISVSVEVGPTISNILVSPENARVTIGSAIDILCVLTDDEALASFTWLDPAGMILPLTFVNATLALVSIISTTSVDYGNYKCIASNLYGNDSETITIFQEVSPPLISSFPVSAIQIISPADLTLSCSAIGHPLPNITWIRTLGNGSQTILSNMSAGNGKEQIILNINDDIMIRSILSITSASLLDTANYTCKAFNMHGNASAHTTARVYLPSPSNVTVISKSSTTLTITWMSALIRTEVMLQNQVNVDYYNINLGYNSETIIINSSTGEEQNITWRFYLEGLSSATTYNISIRAVDASTGEYLSLPSASITAQTLSSSLFQLQFHIDNSCSKWKNDSFLNNSVEIAERLTAELSHLCQCPLPLESTISNGNFYCFVDSQSVVTYRAHITGTMEVVATDLLLHLRKWLKDGPTLMVDNQHLRAEPACSVIISSFNDSGCEAFMTSPTSALTTDLIGLGSLNYITPLIIGGGVGAALLGVVIVIILVNKLCCKHHATKSTERNKNLYDDVELNKISKPIEEPTANLSECHIYEGIIDNSGRQRASTYVCAPCEAYVTHEENTVDDEELYAEI